MDAFLVVDVELVVKTVTLAEAMVVADLDVGVISNLHIFTVGHMVMGAIGATSVRILHWATDIKQPSTIKWEVLHINAPMREQNKQQETYLLHLSNVSVCLLSLYQIITITTVLPKASQIQSSSICRAQ